MSPPPGDLTGPSPRYPRRPLPFPPSAGVSVAGRAAAEGGAGRRPRGGAARPAPRTPPPHRTGRHTGGVGVRRSPDQCGGWPTHIGEASQPNKGTGTLPPACMKCVKSVHAVAFPRRLDSPLGFSPYWCPEVIISPSTFTRTLGACLYAPVRRRVGFGGGSFCGRGAVEGQPHADDAPPRGLRPPSRGRRGEALAPCIRPPSPPNAGRGVPPPEFRRTVRWMESFWAPKGVPFHGGGPRGMSLRVFQEEVFTSVHL